MVMPDYEVEVVDVRTEDIVKAMLRIEAHRGTGMVHLVGARIGGYEVIVDGRWVGYRLTHQQALALIQEASGGH